MSDMEQLAKEWHLRESLSRLATRVVRRELGVTYSDDRRRGYTEHHRRCRTCGGSHSIVAEGPRRLLVLRHEDGTERRTVLVPQPSVSCADCNYRGWVLCTTLEGCTHPDLHGWQS